MKYLPVAVIPVTVQKMCGFKCEYDITRNPVLAYDKQTSCTTICKNDQVVTQLTWILYYTAIDFSIWTDTFVTPYYFENEMWNRIIDMVVSSVYRINKLHT